jgi:hypothetical protein
VCEVVVVAKAVVLRVEGVILTVGVVLVKMVAALAKLELCCLFG